MRKVLKPRTPQPLTCLEKLPRSDVSLVCVCVCDRQRQTQRKETGERTDGDLPSPGAQSPKQAGPAALFLLLVFSEHRGSLPLKYHVKTERGCLIRGWGSKEAQQKRNLYIPNRVT